MADRSRSQYFVAFLATVVMAGACASPAPKAPAAPAPAATANGGAGASGKPMPVLTPSGVVSAAPPPASAPSTAPSAPASGPRLSPDGKLCGGFAGFQCPDKHYCSYANDAHCGAGDMAGNCKPIPELCTMEFAPVCGCDGKTYPSACVAARGAISVASSGACPGDHTPASPIADGQTCGTRGVPGECAKDSYCAYKSQCGATDSGGKCSKKPQICPHLVAPVCGCDGKTYNNGCEAARAGFSVGGPGACTAE